jgi:hypothetical protein
MDFKPNGRGLWTGFLHAFQEASRLLLVAKASTTCGIILTLFTGEVFFYGGGFQS